MAGDRVVVYIRFEADLDTSGDFDWFCSLIRWSEWVKNRLEGGGHHEGFNQIAQIISVTKKSAKDAEFTVAGESPYKKVIREYHERNPFNDPKVPPKYKKGL